MNKNTDIVKFIIEGIQDRKGKQISVVDLICQGSSNMQVAAIADSIRDKVREECGVKPYNYDGYQNSQWIVIDYGDTFVHVFLPDVRQYYNLEELWSDADINEIPDLD